MVEKLAITLREETVNYVIFETKIVTDFSKKDLELLFSTFMREATSLVGENPTKKRINIVTFNRDKDARTDIGALNATLSELVKSAQSQDVKSGEAELGYLRWLDLIVTLTSGVPTDDLSVGFISILVLNEMKGLAELKSAKDMDHANKIIEEWLQKKQSKEE